jgi:DNA-binding MarR family transcriptional regulator
MSDTSASAQALRQFRIIINAVRTHFQHVELAVGLGGAQVWALSVIRDTPGIGVGKLAERMDIHQTTASNLVKSLVQKELIRVDRSGSDRRSVQLSIQDAGAALLAKAPGPFEGLLPRALDGLPPETLARLNSDLGTLIKALQADEDAGRIPLGRQTKP